MVRETGAVKHHLLCIINAWDSNSFLKLSMAIENACRYMSRTETDEEIKVRRSLERRNKTSSRIYQ